MRHFALILIALLASTASCRHTVYTPVTSAVTDSVYTASASHDTLYLLDSVRVEVKGDTVREARTRTIYRTVTVSDTVRLASTDTVRITLPPEKTRGDTVRWHLPAILAVALVSLGIFRMFTKG